ncbi:MAG TPA: YgjP-like metallopeptidase domain-containing protein, partial [Bordetella sp.]|nr:YgjP-like metallopeptidase domain-containing protein [Bordetella sp.]
MPSNGQLELLFTEPEPAAPGAPQAAPLLTPPAPVAASTVATPRPDPLPPGARWREVATEQQTIGFVLLRSRRRSIGFVVADDGLRVTAPNWVTLTQVDDAVREKARWILAKLRDWQARK